MKFYLLPLFILNIINLSHSANILVVLATPFYSHHLVQRNIVSKLLDNGHNLTIITTHPMQYSPKHKVFQHEILGAGSAAHFKYSNILYYKTKQFNSFQIYGSFELKAGHELAKHQMYDDFFHHLVHNPKDYQFDVLIMECLFCPFIVLSEIFDLPIVMFNAGEPYNCQHVMVGNYEHSSISSDIYSIFQLHGKLTFYERIRSYWMNLLTDFWAFSINKLNDAIIQRIFPNLTFPKYEDILVPRLRLFYTLTSTMTAPIRPTVPHFHQIGFMHLKPPKELSDDMEVKQLLDKSVNGVVIVSFGSLVSDFSDEMFMKFADVFKELPYTFIWKAIPERYQHLEIPENILILKWLPIQDMLAHPNMKLMIAHGGLRTIEEAIDREIPMILIPMSYDQPFNSILMTEYGIAKWLDLNHFTKEELTGAIKEMTKDIYKKNIKKMREIVYDKMMTSIDEAVEEIELLIKHNDTYGYMRNAELDSGYLRKFSFDIHLIIAGAFTGLAIIAVYYMPIRMF